MTDNKQWRDLTHDARNVLEWVENPHTDVRHQLAIEVGAFPQHDGRTRKTIADPVDAILFGEISGYVTANPELFDVTDVTDTSLLVRGVFTENAADASAEAAEPTPGF